MKSSFHFWRTTINPYTPPHGIITIPLLILFIILSSSLLQHVDAQSPQDSSSSSSLSDNDDDYALEGSKVSPSMALIIIVLVLGFFITGCISIYIQQCSGNSIIGDPMMTRVGNPIRPNTRGLDMSVIETFPTFVYSDVKELKIGKGALECAVCLNEFEEHETLRLIPKCDHVFHPECIDAWLTGHTTCPVCRADLVPNPTQSNDKEEEESHHETSESGLGGDEVRLNVDTVVPQIIPKGRVSRSHSTGHSLVRPSEDRDRFTLRLPDEVRKQLVVAQPRLKRTISLVALPRASSSRRGYRNSGSDGSGSSRYGRFFGRSFKWISTRSNDNGNGDVDGSTRSKRFYGTVVTPIESLPRVPV